MLRKLMALLLAGTLAAALALPAFADNGGYYDSEDDGDDDHYDDDYEDLKLRSIRLSNDSVRMYEGEIMTLYVTFSPYGAEEDVDWSSSNSDVIQVREDGTVEAVSAGRASVNVKSESGVRTSCQVEVRKVDDFFEDEVDRVEMNLTELTVRIGQTRQLMADVSPSDLAPDARYVTWDTDDAGIAEVSQDGTVSGVALGSATITASAGGKEDSCRVTVVDAFALTGDEKPAAKPATAASATVTGALTAANVRSAVEKVAEATAGGATGTAAFADSGAVTPELMTAAAGAAGGKNVVMRFATTDPNGKRPGYLTLDPKVGRDLKNSISTGVLLAGDPVKAAAATFDKYYQNETAVLELAQTGGYGMTVTIHAQLDLTGMKADNLVFYSYADDKVTKLAVQSYNVDKNGFVRFTTTVGGIIVASDGALVK